MNKILISSCLLGNPVRYDGNSKPVYHDIISHWQQLGCLVTICPEISGGLPVPRPAAEIQNNGKVFTQSGQDVSEQFKRGAQNTLALCQQQNIKIAVLKQSSPSCGSSNIYDGSFSGQKISGMGVTAKLLTQHNIHVFCEQTLVEANQCYEKLEKLMSS